MGRYLKLLCMLILMSVSQITFSMTIEEYIDQKCTKSCVDQYTLLNASKLAADNFNIDYKVIIAIIKVESGFNRSAKNGSSVGLMQVHLRYHRDKFKQKNPTGAYDNIFVGARILNDCMNRAKQNLTKSFNCYNGGGDRLYAVKVNKTLNEIRQLQFD